MIFITFKHELPLKYQPIMSMLTAYYDIVQIDLPLTIYVVVRPCKTSDFDTSNDSNVIVTILFPSLWKFYKYFPIFLFSFCVCYSLVIIFLQIAIKY
jgi:hypothetical protein